MLADINVVSIFWIIDVHLADSYAHGVVAVRVREILVQRYRVGLWRLNGSG